MATMASNQSNRNFAKNLTAPYNHLENEGQDQVDEADQVAVLKAEITKLRKQIKKLSS